MGSKILGTNDLVSISYWILNIYRFFNINSLESYVIFYPLSYINPVLQYWGILTCNFEDSYFALNTPALQSSLSSDLIRELKGKLGRGIHIYLHGSPG